jgi:hypothetical protein
MHPCSVYKGFVIVGDSEVVSTENQIRRNWRYSKVNCAKLLLAPLEGRGGEVLVGI